MIGFSESSGLEIRLIYYPPYHSKYNPVERCWSSLERHWNGEILNSINKAVQWASTMTWKGMQASVSLLDKIYERGVSLTNVFPGSFLLCVHTRRVNSADQGEEKAGGQSAHENAGQTL